MSRASSLSLILSALVVPLWLVTPAVAVELPNYDPEAYCDRVMEMSGGSMMIRNGCIQNEQTAYDDLKESWGSLPEATANYCARVGEMSGGSYMIAKGCVTNETDASQAPKSFRR